MVQNYFLYLKPNFQIKQSTGTYWKLHIGDKHKMLLFHNYNNFVSLLTMSEKHFNIIQSIRYI